MTTRQTAPSRARRAEARRALIAQINMAAANGLWEVTQIQDELLRRDGAPDPDVSRVVLAAIMALDDIKRMSLRALDAEVSERHGHDH